MHDRILYRLTWLAAAMSLGHHLDHLIRFLLRHGRRWRGGDAWALAHERWLCTQRSKPPRWDTGSDEFRHLVASGRRDG